MSPNLREAAREASRQLDSLTETGVGFIQDILDRALAAPDPIEQAARALIQRGEPIDTETLECFYCGSADPVMPWPDSGILRIIHEPTCKWTNLRAALGDTKETPNKSRNARRPKPGGGAA